MQYRLQSAMSTGDMHTRMSKTTTMISDSYHRAITSFVCTYAENRIAVAWLLTD
jgi:hypothetical protein